MKIPTKYALSVGTFEQGQEWRMAETWRKIRNNLL